MKIRVDVSVEGKTSAYESGPFVSRSVTAEIPEVGAVALDGLAPEHVDTLREKAQAALRTAGEKLDAGLDVLEGAALARREKERADAAAAEAEVA